MTDRPLGWAWLGLPLVGGLLLLLLPLLFLVYGMLVAGRILRRTWSWRGRRW